MDTNLIWSFVLASIGVVIIIGQSTKKIWVGLLSLVLQVLWIIFGIATHQYGFVMSAVVYLWWNTRKMDQWHREQKKVDPRDLNDFDGEGRLVRGSEYPDLSMPHIELVVRKDGSIRERELRMKGYVIGD